MARGTPRATEKSKALYRKNGRPHDRPLHIVLRGYLLPLPVIFPPWEYDSGESFTCLGRNYRLKVDAGKPVLVKLKQGRLWVQVPGGRNNPEKVKDALTQWYRTHAEQKLKEKAGRYAKIIGVSPSTVGIKTFKSRWGSCDS